MYFFSIRDKIIPYFKDFHIAVTGSPNGNVAERIRFFLHISAKIKLVFVLLSLARLG